LLQQQTLTNAAGLLEHGAGRVNITLAGAFTKEIGNRSATAVKIPQQSMDGQSHVYKKGEERAAYDGE
jgi:hypothetical protein